MTGSVAKELLVWLGKWFHMVCSLAVNYDNQGMLMNGVNYWDNKMIRAHK